MSNVLLGPLADNIRATWIEFGKHCGVQFRPSPVGRGIFAAGVADGCTDCRGERAALSADLQDESLDRQKKGVFSRHREHHAGCCPQGKTLLEPWIAAVHAHAEHYRDNRTRRTA